jgi:hypothetical protein
MRSRFYITYGCGDLEVWLREFLGGWEALDSARIWGQERII